MSPLSSNDGTLDIDDVRIRFRIDGLPGAPWLVFSNSLMMDLTLWDGQVQAFGDRYRILRYVQRGHGGSSVPAVDCTFPRLVDDLAALLDHLDIESVCVIGISMGGVTALGFAALHPGRVSQVAICDCQARSTASGATAWDERIAIASAGGMAELVEPTIRRWFTPETSEGDIASLASVRRMIRDMQREGFVRAARALQSYDFGSYPAMLGCPALFLVGAADAALPGVMRDMAAAAPNGSYVSIPGSGHLPNIEQPGLFNAAVASFLARSR